MGRKRNDKAIEAERLYKEGHKLVDIAESLDVPQSTVRRWKCSYKWDVESERSDKKIPSVRNKSEVKKSVESVSENEELTDKERLFCLIYVKCFNATKAYKTAFECSYSTALTNGPATLGKTRIKSEIQKLKKIKFENVLMVTKEDVIAQYMKIAFADLGDYIEWGTEEVQVVTKYGPLFEKDPETGEEKKVMRTVNYVRLLDSSEVDTSIVTEVKQGRDGISVKLADKMKALEKFIELMNLKPKTAFEEESDSIIEDDPYEALSTDELRRLLEIAENDDK